jgi:hypothetical protein
MSPRRFVLAGEIYMRIFGGSARPVCMRIFGLTFGWASLCADFRWVPQKNRKFARKIVKIAKIARCITFRAISRESVAMLEFLGPCLE